MMDECFVPVIGGGGKVVTGEFKMGKVKSDGIYITGEKISIDLGGRPKFAFIYCLGYIAFVSFSGYRGVGSAFPSYGATEWYWANATDTGLDIEGRQPAVSEAQGHYFAIM